MLKAGIIGLGKMGISHCCIIGAHPGIESLAVCDTSSFVLGAFRKYSSFHVYDDYQKMLKEEPLDAVVISTPTRLHVQMAELALNHNLHVFLEKPMTLSVADDQKLVDIARHKNLITQVGYHNRFVSIFREVKRLLENNVIGDIVHVFGEAYGPVVLRESNKTWRSETAEGGGCLNDYASHVINLLNFYLGMPDRVEGTILKKIFSHSVEDAVYSNLFFPSKITASLAVNWSDETYRKMSTRVTLFGKKGKIVADPQELKVHVKQDMPEFGFVKGWNVRYLTNFKEDIQFYLRGEEYSLQIDHFIRAVGDGKPTSYNTFEHAMQTDAVIAMLRSDAKDA
jgi:predicted dehydrogenase